MAKQKQKINNKFYFLKRKILIIDKKLRKK